MCPSVWYACVWISCVTLCGAFVHVMCNSCVCVCVCVFYVSTCVCVLCECVCLFGYVHVCVHVHVFLCLLAHRYIYVYKKFQRVDYGLKLNCTAACALCCIVYAIFSGVFHITYPVSLFEKGNCNHWNSTTNLNTNCDRVCCLNM